MTWRLTVEILSDIITQSFILQCGNATIAYECSAKYIMWINNTIVIIVVIVAYGRKTNYVWTVHLVHYLHHLIPLNRPATT